MANYPDSKKPRLGFDEKLDRLDKVELLVGRQQLHLRIFLDCCVPEFASRNVFLPTPDLYPWVKDFIKELLLFPKSAHKDLVDAASQALNWLAKKGGRIVARDVKEQPHSTGYTRTIFSETTAGVRNSTKVIRGFF